MRLPTLGLGLRISDSPRTYQRQNAYSHRCPFLFLCPSSSSFCSCTLVECFCAVLSPFITTISIPVSPATPVAVITISFLLLLPLLP